MSFEYAKLIRKTGIRNFHRILILGSCKALQTKKDEQLKNLADLGSTVTCVKI